MPTNPTPTDRTALVEDLYGELATLLAHVAATQQRLAEHYREGSVAHTEHHHAARAAATVAAYWRDRVAKHAPDLVP